MRNVLLLAVVMGVVGLVLGYVIFARAPVTGDLISIGNLIDPPDGLLGRIVEEVGQFARIRRNILLSGGGGVVVGVIMGLIVGRR